MEVVIEDDAQGQSQKGIPNTVQKKIGEHKEIKDQMDQYCKNEVMPPPSLITPKTYKTAK